MASSVTAGALISIGASILLNTRTAEEASLYAYARGASTLFFIFCITKVVYTVLLYPYFFTPFRHLPVPPGRHFLHGHFYDLIKKPPGPLTRQWFENVPNEGLMRIYLFANTERLLVSGAKCMSDIFVHKAYDFVKTEQLKASLGRLVGQGGILLVEGNEHKTQRKFLTPAFAFRHVKDLYPLFWAKSVEMVEMIEKTVKDLPEEGKVIEVKEWASKATLDIIGLAGMDSDFQSLQHPNNPLVFHYRNAMKDPPFYAHILQGLAFFFKPRLLNAIPLKWNRDMDACKKAIQGECRKLVAKKRHKFEKGETKGVDLLSIAMQSGGFSDENLVDQMMTFLLAGHETTATAVQWVIYALCNNLSIQTRLRSELHDSLPSSLLQNPSELTASQIDSLPYLNAVCNEVLRFYPPVPMTVREAAVDTTVGNQPISKGTVLVMSAEATNRSVELWGPDANVFDPERWMVPGKANTGGATTNYASATFIYGPRSCIGQGFAKGELACLVAAMVGRFEMELEDPEKEVKVKTGITSGPVDGVRARIRVLEDW